MIFQPTTGKTIDQDSIIALGFRGFVQCLRFCIFDTTPAQNKAGGRLCDIIPNYLENMLTPIFRIILVIINFVFAAYFFSKENYVSMSMMLIASGLFIYGYFKYGTVYIAFQQLKKGNPKKAEELISKINNPENLTKEHKRYYYLTSGIIALEKKELDKSHSDLTQTLKIGLRTENDKSIVLLNLANVEFLRKDYGKAMRYIEKVRQLKLTALVESETNRIEEEIKNVAQHM